MFFMLNWWDREPQRLVNSATYCAKKLDDFLDVCVHQVYAHNRSVMTPDPDETVQVTNAIEDEIRPVVTADRNRPQTIFHA